MAILIRDMDMPDNCEDCPCGYETEGVYEDECQVLSREWEKDATSNRPDWCPLVEIPKGVRLIDARDVKKHMIPLDFSVQNWISEVDLDIKVPTIFKEDE